MDRLPLQGIQGHPNGLRGLITIFTSLQPLFTSQQPIFTVFGCSPKQQIRSGKNDTKMDHLGLILARPPYRVFKALPKGYPQMGTSFTFNLSPTLSRLVQGDLSQIDRPDLGGSSIIHKNEIKMIKRDWKLPNPSFFTYTSIVQPVLQADSPFSQLFCCL